MVLLGEPPWLTFDDHSLPPLGIPPHNGDLLSNLSNCIFCI